MEKPIRATVPPAVTIVALEKHFKGTYQLGDDQVELMVYSSKKSMDKILADSGMVLGSAEVSGELVNIFHSLKGLLLNMGQPQWAEVAKELERAAKAGEKRDYAAAIDIFRVGMAAVTAYKDDQ